MGNHWLSIRDAWEYRHSGDTEQGESQTHIRIDDGTDDGTESYIQLPLGGTAASPLRIATDRELAHKQDVISDLATIRSGASAGATAVQPASLTAALSTKQDVISDLATIRSGASAGATAVQPASLTSALAAKQDTLVNETNIKSINGMSLLGSGSITISPAPEIDGKTIVSTTAGLATAVGGWEENLGMPFGSFQLEATSSSEYDLTDAEVAAALYENLQTGVRYDLETDPLQDMLNKSSYPDLVLTEAYLQFNNKTDTSIGEGENALHMVIYPYGLGNQPYYADREFYVMNSSGSYPNRIHIYDQGDYFENQESGGEYRNPTLSIQPKELIIVHKIDSKYYDSVEIDPTAYGLKLSNGKLSLEMNGESPIYVSNSQSGDDRIKAIGLNVDQSSPLTVSNSALSFDYLKSNKVRYAKSNFTHQGWTDGDWFWIDDTQNPVPHIDAIKTALDDGSFVGDIYVVCYYQVGGTDENYVYQSSGWFGAKDETVEWDGATCNYRYYEFNGVLWARIEVSQGNYIYAIGLNNYWMNESYPEFGIICKEIGIVDVTPLPVSVLPDIPASKITGNIPAPSNMVTTDTDQTITGQKSFVSPTNILAVPGSGDSRLYFKSVSGSTEYAKIRVFDDLFQIQDSRNYGLTFTYARDSSSSQPQSVPGNFSPDNYASAGYTLGTSSNKWKDLYLSGNVSDGSSSASIANVISAANATPVHLYEHCVLLQASGIYANMFIFNDSTTAYTASTLMDYALSLTDGQPIQANGFYNRQAIVSTQPDITNNAIKFFYTNSTSVNSMTVTAADITNVTDTVLTIL